MNMRNDGEYMAGFLEQVEVIQKIRSQGQFRLGLARVQQMLRAAQGLSHSQRAYLYKQNAIFLHDLGEEEKAAAAFWESVCKSAVLTEQQEDYSNYLLLSHYLETLSDEELAQRHFGYQQLYQDTCRWEYVPNVRKKLRIGYLSPDFRQHIVADFAWPFFFQYDRQRFEVVCYDTKDKSDEITHQIRSAVDGWKNLAGLAPEKAAQEIHGDQIDILIDLAGHSEGGHTLRIAGYKPAPVQVSGIGYMSTTGLHAMDYFLTDGYCDPLGTAERLFSERLLRLPQSHFCYHPPERLLRAADYPEVPHRGLVFGSFNNFSKITDSMLLIWLKILQMVPGAKLLLKNSHPNRRAQEKNMHRRLEQLGYRPGQYEVRSSSVGYLREYQEMDIALDTYPYVGGGTTCEALYMGVPVITLYGTRHGTRFGYSLLRNLELGELAAADPEDYIRKAAALAQDRILLEILKKQLRGRIQVSPLMDQQAYMESVQAAYEEIWQHWCNL